MGARVTPQFLRSYLSDPHGSKPGATMPDVLNGEDPAVRQTTVENLANYLVSLGGPVAPAKVEGNLMLVEQGRSLYHNVGCVACHAPEQGYVPISDKGASESPQPTETHGGAEPARPPRARRASRSPTCRPCRWANWRPRRRWTSSRPSCSTRSRPGPTAACRPPTSAPARRGRLAVYLLRDQLKNPQSANAGPVRADGVRYAYYEGNSVETADLVKLEKLKPKSEGTIDNFKPDVPGHRDENFAVRFTGALHVPAERATTGSTSSPTTAPASTSTATASSTTTAIHSPAEKSGAVDLKVGDHPIAVTFFQGGGGFELSLEWEGPQTRRGPIPDGALFHVGGRPMVPLGSEPLVRGPKKGGRGEAGVRQPRVRRLPRAAAT